MTSVKKDRSLVVIELQGGNDAGDGWIFWYVFLVSHTTVSKPLV